MLGHTPLLHGSSPSLLHGSSPSLLHGSSPTFYMAPPPSFYMAPPPSFYMAPPLPFGSPVSDLDLESLLQCAQEGFVMASTREATAKTPAPKVCAHLHITPPQPIFALLPNPYLHSSPTHICTPPQPIFALLPNPYLHSSPTHICTPPQPIFALLLSPYHLHSTPPQPFFVIWIAPTVIGEKEATDGSLERSG